MKRTVLICDDDTFLTTMYRLSLQKEGRTISLASDGEEAMTVMDKQQPHLLILDLMMPRMDGFQVLEKIKERGWAFPVIILSNIRDAMDKDKCRELGAKDYFCKSETDLEGLARMVEKYLEGK